MNEDCYFLESKVHSHKRISQNSIVPKWLKRHYEHACLKP